ncbi:hypothetical protein CYLTODRAFT_486119 [Cylindrobasidium torrendii FP15055 ss-10]|uniref:Uncharacterized protein n=1 Tax=Cylindrobasidium torrendii FP15055 ss-10 TaxID=1314674 RepID=A0A0D7BR55_9AGAR|nr:hypothetical protein CYLTODRAFT_486119 [Cylindrobasidium torrendii FP15055 ss-10]
MPVAPPEPVVQRKWGAEKPYARRRESKLLLRIDDDNALPTLRNPAYSARSLRSGMKKTSMSTGNGEGTRKEKEKRKRGVSFAIAPETISTPDGGIGQRNRAPRRESTPVPRFADDNKYKNLNETSDDGALIFDCDDAFAVVDSAVAAGTGVDRTGAAPLPLPETLSEIFASLTFRDTAAPAPAPPQDVDAFGSPSTSASSSNTLVNLTAPPSSAILTGSTEDVDCLSSLFAVGSDTDEEDEQISRRPTSTATAPTAMNIRTKPAATTATKNKTQLTASKNTAATATVDIEGWLSDAAKQECVGIVQQSSLVVRRHRGKKQWVPYERCGRRVRGAAHFGAGGHFAAGDGKTEMGIVLGRPSVEAQDVDVEMDGGV